MDFSTLDIVTFIGFIAIVVGVSLYAGRKEEGSEDYFLAGRGLSWWLIGLSLIASNISSGHFIGMSGKGFGLGLAIASYEWMAAITLVIVGIFFLPRFLKMGIYTIPQYLEYRYNDKARLIMAIYMMFFYILVTLATVLFTGAVALNRMFDINITLGIWMIGLLAGVYTVYGGLKAVVWSDLIQGTTLLVGGLIVMFLCFKEFGSELVPVIDGASRTPMEDISAGIGKFREIAGDKLHTVLPWDHPEMPWVAVFIGGLWLPNIFYWGLNQFITQRTLGAKSIKEGQKGIIFGAFLKLLIPFIVVFPGIMAFYLYGDLINEEAAMMGGEVANPGDLAYPMLMQKVLPAGLIGVMFAALFGAVMSTLDSLLNSAATIFTIDIYQARLKPDASSKDLVKVGRIATLVLVLVGCLWAPQIGSFGALYDYIQKFWGLIQGGIVAAFVFGILWKKVPSGAAIGAMLLNIPVYGACLIYDEFQPEGEKIAFLHYMAITFIILSAYMVIYTLIKPDNSQRVMPNKHEVDYKLSPGILITSVIVVIATIALYIVFA